MFSFFWWWLPVEVETSRYIICWSYLKNFFTYKIVCSWCVLLQIQTGRMHAVTAGCSIWKPALSCWPLTSLQLLGDILRDQYSSWLHWTELLEQPCVWWCWARCRGRSRGTGWFSFCHMGTARHANVERGFSKSGCILTDTNTDMLLKMLNARLSVRDLFYCRFR